MPQRPVIFLPWSACILLPMSVVCLCVSIEMLFFELRALGTRGAPTLSADHSSDHSSTQITHHAVCLRDLNVCWCCFLHAILAYCSTGKRHTIGGGVPYTAQQRKGAAWARKAEAAAHLGRLVLKRAHRDRRPAQPFVAHVVFFGRRRAVWGQPPFAISPARITSPVVPLLLSLSNTNRANRGGCFTPRRAAQGGHVMHTERATRRRRPSRCNDFQVATWSAHRDEQPSSDASWAHVVLVGRPARCRAILHFLPFCRHAHHIAFRASPLAPPPSLSTHTNQSTRLEVGLPYTAARRPQKGPRVLRRGAEAAHLGGHVNPTIKGPR
jgi:hypothetical protein